MKIAICRALLRLASACLGKRHAEWACAMEAEFDTARSEGAPLTFAFGCLLAAGRTMLSGEEGRFVLTSYGLVLGLLLPMAALQIGCALFGLPYLYPDRQGLAGALWMVGPYETLLRGVYQAAIPTLAGLQLLIGLGHLRVGWLLLERDWSAAMRWSSMTLSASATLVVFMGVLFLNGQQALLQGAVLGIELGIIAAVARWHGQLMSGEVPQRAI